MRGTAISNWVKIRSLKLVQSRSNEARATINFLLLYQGSSPFTHCTTSAIFPIHAQQMRIIMIYNCRMSRGHGEKK
jgi:hypothetical protein